MSGTTHRRAIRRPALAAVLAAAALLLVSSPARGIGGLLPPVTTTTLPSAGDLVGAVTTLPVVPTLPPTTIPPTTLPPTTLVPVPTTLPDDGGATSGLKEGLDDVGGTLDGLLGDGSSGGGGDGGGGSLGDLLDGDGPTGDLLDGGGPTGDGLPRDLVERLLREPTDASAADGAVASKAGGSDDTSGRDGTAREGARRPSAGRGLAREVGEVLGTPTPPAARLQSAHLLRVATESAQDFGFPLLLALLVLLYLVAQGWLDRRDPKLTAAPVSSDDDLVTFR